MNFDVFEFRGKLIIPTLAQMVDGIYIQVEPVIVIPQPEVESVTAAFHEVQARGNPRIPNLRPKDFPPPVVLPHAGVKTNKAFEKIARAWSVSAKPRAVIVTPYTRYPKGGYVIKRADEIEFNGEEALNDAAAWLVRNLSAGT